LRFGVVKDRPVEVGLHTGMVPGGDFQQCPCRYALTKARARAPGAGCERAAASGWVRWSHRSSFAVHHRAVAARAMLAKALTHITAVLGWGMFWR